MKHTEPVDYTERQLDVLGTYLKCLTYEKASEELGIMPETYRAHLRLIFKQTHNHCARQLVVYLFANGFWVNESLTEVWYKGRLIG